MKRSDFLYHVFMSTRHLAAGGSKKHSPSAMVAKAGLKRAMRVSFVLGTALLGGPLNFTAMAHDVLPPPVAMAPAGTSLPAISTAPALGANLPRLGDAGGEDLSPLAEQRLGEMAMREVRRDPDYLDDPEINDWLGQFGHRLVGSVPGGVMGQEFEFFAIRDRSLNAFALPGGFIGVHTGLLLAVANESELASVLGHEIGHVTQRHIARTIAQQRQAAPMAIAALALAVLAARSSPNAAMGMSTLGSSLVQSKMLSFSRDAEREADRVGFETLRNAGFDPSASAMFFTRLQQATRAYDSPAAPAYLRSHPLTSERIADMQARSLGFVPLALANAPSFFMVRARARALQDPSVDGLRGSATFFERSLEDRSMPELAAWYGLALVAATQRNFAAVPKFLINARAVAPGAAHPWLDRLEIDARVDSGDASGAVALARAARVRYPDIRAIAYAEARALLVADQPQQGVERLSDATARWPGDPHLWEQLSRAYGALGQRALAHRAAGEAAIVRRAWQSAFEQFRLAQRAGDADFISASMIDARFRMVEAEALRERAELGRQVR